MTINQAGPDPRPGHPTPTRGLAVVAVATGLVVLSAGTAAADTGWTTTTVEPTPRRWSTTVVQDAAPTPMRLAPVTRAPRPTHRAARRVPVRRHLPWRPTSTCQAPGPWTVRPGDTLSLVAWCTRTTVAEVAAVNRIPDPDLIRVGAVLDAPPAAVAR
jgi:nucleoid-associated protein YgaU